MCLDLLRQDVFYLPVRQGRPRGSSLEFFTTGVCSPGSTLLAARLQSFVSALLFTYMIIDDLHLECFM